MKKLLLLMSALILSFSLAACGDNSDNANAENQSENTTENEAADNDEENADEDVKESEFGKMAIIYKDEDLEVTEETGPFRLKVTALQIGDIEIIDEYRELFNDKDEATIITVNLEVENTEDATNGFYADQATLTTDTGEQVEADMFLSDDVGGDFIGEVKKDGDIFFILDSEADKINKVNLHIDAPHDEDFDTIGDDLKLEFEIE